MGDETEINKQSLCLMVSVSLKTLLIPFCAIAFSIFWMRIPALNLIRSFSNMATRHVEPYSMAFVTAPNKDVAKSLAGGLVEKKLAACVNVIPGIISVYEWEGKIENDDEVLMMIKTRTSRIPELTDYVKTNHPYDVAEVITTSIEQGNQPYLDWLGKIVPEKH